MSSDASYFYGWEPIYATVKSNIRHEADLIMVLTHWCLTKQSFRCLGVGEDKILLSNETGSELLPELWNANDQTYTLRYICNGKLYLLAGTIYLDDKKIIINLVDVNTYKIGVITINYKEEVKSIIGPLSYMIPNVQKMIDNIKLNLIEQVVSQKNETAETQTQTEPLFQPGSQRTDDSRTQSQPTHIQFHDDDDEYRMYVGVGRRDLDPFYRGGGAGGGMLFPSPGSSGIIPPFGDRRPYLRLRHPPPPGARYDPIFPSLSGTSILSNPNPDHMRPLPDDDNIYY